MQKTATLEEEETVRQRVVWILPQFNLYFVCGNIADLQMLDIFVSFALRLTIHCPEKLLSMMNIDEYGSYLVQCRWASDSNYLALFYLGQKIEFHY